MNSNLILSGLAVAVLMIFQTTASAAEGAIGSETLSAMGLGGAVVVSDYEATAVRGHGFRPIAIAAGGSFAHVGGPWSGAGSVNGYFAAGNNFAAGANGSVAGKTVSKTTTKRIFGVPVLSVRKTRSVNVYAGGFSAAVAF